MQTMNDLCYLTNYIYLNIRIGIGLIVTFYRDSFELYT